MTGISPDGGEWQPPAPSSTEGSSAYVPAGSAGYPPAEDLPTEHLPTEDRSWFRPAAKRRALATSALAAALLFVGGGFAGYELNGSSGSSASTVQGGPGGAGGFSAEGGAGGQGAPSGGQQGGFGGGGAAQNGTAPTAAG